MSDVVNKLWGFCHTLRHDGIDYGDYIEQLTYLLFLKLADEKGGCVLRRHQVSPGALIASRSSANRGASSSVLFHHCGS